MQPRPHTVRRARGLTLVTVLTVATLVAASCSSSGHSSDPASLVSATPTAPKGTWTGTVDGTDALVGITSDGLEVAAYVCDSAKTSAWFRGLAGGGRARLSDGHGATLDLSLAASGATGAFTGADGVRHTFTAARSARPVLFRAEATVGGKPVVAGWIVGARGTQRGALNSGTSVLPAPKITVPTTVNVPPTIPVVIDVGARSAQVAASAIVDTSTAVVTKNTTGFDDFVIVGMGDSYAAGEGNPFKPAGLTVSSTLTAWDKLAAGAVISGAAALETPIGLVAALGGPALVALAVAAHAGGENLMPEVPGLGENKAEQWGEPAAGSSTAADEHYRKLCHRGISPEEKVFQRLSADPKYRGVVNLVFYNLACAGSQTRHLYSTAYDGNPDFHNGIYREGSNAVPPQLDQVRAVLGDTSESTATTRTFLANEHVTTLPDLPLPNDPVPHIDALYVSSGGNDLGFGAIIQKCAVFPLPDCGNGSNGTQNMDAALHSGGDVNIQHPIADRDLAHDNAYPGLNSLADSYQTFDSKLRDLSVKTADGKISVTPSQVYFAEGPNPLEKTSTALCAGSEGALHDDLLGLLSVADTNFASGVATKLDDAIDAGATVADSTPRSDGRDHWNVVTNRHAFRNHALCTSDRFVQTGADALAVSGNDVGVDGVLEASDGTMHPNDRGYSALADNLEPLVRAQLDAMIAAIPAKATRLRQVSAVRNGAIGLRWDDRANNDTFTQLLARTPGSTGPFHPVRDFGADANSFTVNPGARSPRSTRSRCARASSTAACPTRSSRRTRRRRSRPASPRRSSCRRSRGSRPASSYAGTRSSGTSRRRSSSAPRRTPTESARSPSTVSGSRRRRRSPSPSPSIRRRRAARRPPARTRCGSAAAICSAAARRATRSRSASSGSWSRRSYRPIPVRPSAATRSNRRRRSPRPRDRQVTPTVAARDALVRVATRHSRTAALTDGGTHGRIS